MSVPDTTGVIAEWVLANVSSEQLQANNPNFDQTTWLSDFYEHLATGGILCILLRNLLGKQHPDDYPICSAEDVPYQENAVKDSGMAADNIANFLKACIDIDLDPDALCTCHDIATPCAESHPRIAQTLLLLAQWSVNHLKQAVPDSMRAAITKSGLQLEELATKPAAAAAAITGTTTNNGGSRGPAKPAVVASWRTGHVRQRSNTPYANHEPPVLTPATSIDSIADEAFLYGDGDEGDSNDAKTVVTRLRAATTGSMALDAKNGPPPVASWRTRARANSTSNSNTPVGSLDMSDGSTNSAKWLQKLELKKKGLVTGRKSGGSMFALPSASSLEDNRTALQKRMMNYHTWNGQKKDSYFDVNAEDVEIVFSRGQPKRVPSILKRPSGLSGDFSGLASSLAAGAGSSGTCSPILDRSPEKNMNDNRHKRCVSFVDGFLCDGSRRDSTIDLPTQALSSVFVDSIIYEDEEVGGTMSLDTIQESERKEIEKGPPNTPVKTMTSPVCSKILGRQLTPGLVPPSAASLVPGVLESDNEEPENSFLGQEDSAILEDTFEDHEDSLIVVKGSRSSSEDGFTNTAKISKPPLQMQPAIKEEDETAHTFASAILSSSSSSSSAASPACSSPTLADAEAAAAAERIRKFAERLGSASSSANYSAARSIGSTDISSNKDASGTGSLINGKPAKRDPLSRWARKDMMSNDKDGANKDSGMPVVRRKLGEVAEPKYFHKTM